GHSHVQGSVMTRINGFCPMGCGETLSIGKLGSIECVDPRCPRPDAVAVILGNSETEHVVELQLDGVSVQHPPRERLDGDLFGCTLLAEIQSGGVPLLPLGRYRIVPHDDGYLWDRVTL